MEEKKEEGQCGKGGCGLHCGCCACKAIKALMLLLVGGAIGFGIAHCCHRRAMCAKSAGAAVQSESVPMPTAAPKTK